MLPPPTLAVCGEGRDSAQRRTTHSVLSSAAATPSQAGAEGAGPSFTVTAAKGPASRLSELPPEPSEDRFVPVLAFFGALA